MRKTIKYNGSTVSYEYIKGNEKTINDIPILFLHGTNSDGYSSYGKIIETYFTNRNVILIDYAGCGESSLPNKHIDVEYLANQVISVVSDLNIESFDLVGHSLGAVVSIVIAAKLQDKVNKLVVSAPWRTSSDPRHKLFFGLWYDLEKEDPKKSLLFGLTHAFSPEFLSHLGTETINHISNQKGFPDTDKRIEIGMQADVEQFIENITCPSLVIGCKKDTLIPTYMVKKVFDGIKVSSYCEVDSGHAVQIENPHDWSKEIIKFI